MRSIEVVIRQPGFPDRVIPLSEGRVRLGRADDNEIVLSDVGVSRRHAQIVVNGGEVSIEDLGSGNGTYHLGHRIKVQALRDEDEVVIDPFALQFRITGAPADQPTAPAPPALLEQARIEVVVGNGMVGNNFPIENGELTMGRAEDRDVVVPDAASSRHHCHITLEGGEYVLHDNGSANGVFVNAVRVRECTLSGGDLIRIGNTEMRFVLPGESPVAGLNPSEAAAPQPLVAGAYPVEPSSDPVATLVRGEHVFLPDDPVDEVAEPSNNPMIAAVVVSVVAIASALAVVVLLAVGVLWYIGASPVQVREVPPRPPAWSIDLPVAPTSTKRQLLDEAETFAANGEHKKVLESLLRVLRAENDNEIALKFSAYAAEMLLTSTFQTEMNQRLEKERKRTTRRRRLIRDLENGNYSRKRSARKALLEDYRDDPEMIAYTAKNPGRLGAWGMTAEQTSARNRLDRMRNELSADQFAKSVRTGNRLLAESVEAEVRNPVHEELDKATKALATRVAEQWREAIMFELDGDKQQAIKNFKAILVEDPQNASAKLHLSRLEAGP